MSSGVKSSFLLVCVVWLAACQQMPVQETADEEPVADSTTEVDTALREECVCPEPEPQPLPPEPVATKSCPPPSKKTDTPKKSSSARELKVLGRVEYVTLMRNGAEKNGLRLKSRIDTGAGLSSLHAQELVDFERDGKPWVRFAVLEPKTDKPVYFERRVRRYVDIKYEGGEAQRRPVVNMSLTLGDIEENLEVTLTDRSGYVYQALIGRNFLRDRVVVDVSRKFIADDNVTVY